MDGLRAVSSIDLSRALRTEDELQTLVDAIYRSPATAQETNWLEWKNQLDVMTKAGKFAVAKAILGFANRSEEQAQLACEGVAYMVVGVEPAAASGVGVVDHAVLGQALKTYAHGVRWTPFYIDFNNVTVLVIVVEAPRAGDPIHTLQKTYNDSAKYNVNAGTIFHRGTAQTEPAGPAEIIMLSKRLLDGVQRPALDLSLTAVADPLVRLSLDQADLDDWLRRHEAYVRARSGKPPDPPPPQPAPADPWGFSRSHAFDALMRAAALGPVTGQYADPSDAKEFEERLGDYLTRIRARLSGYAINAVVVDDDCNTVHFVVRNDTDDPVSKVQLTVRIPRDGVAVYTSAPQNEPLPPLPKWPNLLDHMKSVGGGAITVRPSGSPGPKVVKHVDVFEITWNVGDLRPHQRSDSCRVTVCVGPRSRDLVKLEMVARSMDHRGITTATESLTVSNEVWTIDRILHADRSSRGAQR